MFFGKETREPLRFHASCRHLLCPMCYVAGPRELRKAYRRWLRWLPLPVLFWLHDRMMHPGRFRYQDRIRAWREGQSGR